MKLDLHCHTLFSQDGSSEPEACIEQAIALGLDGIAFTEHDSFDVSEPVEKLREAYLGRIVVLRGVEYPSAEGHVLVFGVRSDRLLPGHYAPLREIVACVRDAGGVAIVPHPCRGWLALQAEHDQLRGIHAIEAFNGRNTGDENAAALTMAAQLSLPTTGGSDAHEAAEVGRCYTEFSDEVTPANFLDLLRQGRYRGIDARNGKLLHAAE